jgi:hypothetical protein
MNRHFLTYSAVLFRNIWGTGTSNESVLTSKVFICIHCNQVSKPLMYVYLLVKLIVLWLRKCWLTNIRLSLSMHDMLVIQVVTSLASFITSKMPWLAWCARSTCHHYSNLDQQYSSSLLPMPSIPLSLVPASIKTTQCLWAHILKGCSPFIQLIMSLQCFWSRKFRQRFLTKDVERLLVTISHLLLDQDRVTLGNLIQSCLMTLVDSFTDEEWTSSCGNIAAHISRSTFCFPSAMWGFHLYKSFFSLILKCETISTCGLQADHWETQWVAPSPRPMWQLLQDGRLATCGGYVRAL